MGINLQGLTQSLAVRKHAGGKFARVITSVEAHQSDEGKATFGAIMWKVKHAALEDVEDLNSKVAGTEIQHMLTLPLDTDEFSTAAENVNGWVYRMASQFLSAVVDEALPAPPFKDRDDEEGEWVYQGEAVSKADQQSCKLEAYRMAAEYCDENLRESASDLVGHCFYCEVLPKDGSNFADTKNFRAMIPDDWELSQEFITVDEYQAEIEEEIEAPKRGGKKKTKKKTAKRSR